MELYNDQMSDLLQTQDCDDLSSSHRFASASRGASSARNKGQYLSARNSSSTHYQVKENNIKGVYVDNISELPVKTVEDAYLTLLYGLQRRKMFATVKNQESSRSHTIFQVKL